MTQTLLIARTITSLAQVESTFNIRPADDQFFTEWDESLPELTNTERSRLDVIKQRFLYHRKHGHLVEGTVNYIVMSLIHLQCLQQCIDRLKMENNYESNHDRSH